MSILEIEDDERALELTQRSEIASNFRLLIFAHSYRPWYNVALSK